MEAIEINTIKNEAVKQTHLSELWVYVFNYLLYAQYLVSRETGK